MQELRVLVVDDESLIRRALTVFVSEADDIEVVGEAANGADALTAVESLAPDVGRRTVAGWSAAP